MKTSAYANIIAAIVTGSVSVGACGGNTQSDGASVGADAGPSDGSSTDARIDAGGFDAAPRPGFIPTDCGDGGARLGALSATPAFDYVELRAQDGYQANEKDEVLEKVGTLCAKAADVSACKTAFAAIENPVKLSCSVPYPCTVEYLAFTRGDEVGTLIRGESALAKMAAPIDSIEEAAFALSWSGSFQCSGSSYREAGDGYDVAYTYYVDRCITPSNAGRHDILAHVSRDGTITILEDVRTIEPADPNVGCAAARRAAGVDYERPASMRDAADWLAAAAHLEAASVASFARLARELAAHGAPLDLVRRAARAAREERRHARVLRKLVRALAPEKRIAKAPCVGRQPRSLLAVAIENAVEGATRETFGAVVVAHQARAAATPSLRRAFALIAEDEANHAELAADVDTWMATRLSVAECAEVERIRQRATVEVEREALAELPETVRLPLGLPSPAVARELFERTRSTLFAGREQAEIAA